MKRSEAKSAGMKYYSTGKPCKHGHVSYRLVSDRTCIECRDLRNESTREQRREYDKLYRREKRRPKTQHEMKLYIVNHPKVRDLTVLSRWACRSKAQVSNILRELGITPRRRPEHYIG